MVSLKILRVVGMEAVSAEITMRVPEVLTVIKCSEVLKRPLSVVVKLVDGGLAKISECLKHALVQPYVLRVQPTTRFTPADE